MLLELQLLLVRVTYTNIFLELQVVLVRIIPIFFQLYVLLVRVIALLVFHMENFFANIYFRVIASINQSYRQYQLELYQHVFRVVGIISQQLYQYIFRVILVRVIGSISQSYTNMFLELQVIITNACLELKEVFIRVSNTFLELWKQQ